MEHFVVKLLYPVQIQRVNINLKARHLDNAEQMQLGRQPNLSVQVYKRSPTASACQLLSFTSDNYFRLIFITNSQWSDYLNACKTYIRKHPLGHINVPQVWRLSLTCTELSPGRALTHSHHINTNGAVIGRQIKWCELSG